MLYKVRYCAVALAWASAAIATYLYWDGLSWPLRIGIMVLLVLMTPAMSDIFESYEQWARERRKGQR